MPRPYSNYLRERVAASVLDGRSCRETDARASPVNSRLTRAASLYCASRRRSCCSRGCSGSGAVVGARPGMAGGCIPAFSIARPRSPGSGGPS